MRAVRVNARMSSCGAFRVFAFFLFFFLDRSTFLHSVLYTNKE